MTKSWDYQVGDIFTRKTSEGQLLIVPNFLNTPYTVFHVRPGKTRIIAECQSHSEAKETKLDIKLEWHDEEKFSWTEYKDRIYFITYKNGRYWCEGTDGGSTLEEVKAQILETLN